MVFLLLTATRKLRALQLQSFALEFIKMQLQNQNRHLEVSNRTTSLMCNEKPQHILSSGSNKYSMATARCNIMVSNATVAQPEEIK